MMKRDDQILVLMEKLFDEKTKSLNDRLEQRLKNIDEKIDDLSSVIKGNGKKGLVDEIIDIKTYISNMRIYGSIFVMVLSFVISVAKDFIIRQFK